VKLSGRAQGPDWSRGCKLSFCTRGDTTEPHGPLGRLLEVSPMMSGIAVQQTANHLLVWDLGALRLALEKVHASLA
jgi:hypothetical protein